MSHPWFWTFPYFSPLSSTQLHFSKTFKSICLQFKTSLWKDWEWNIWWIRPHSSWEKKKKSSHLLKEIVCVRETDIKSVEWTPNWNEGMMTLAWLWLHTCIENRCNLHAPTGDNFITVSFCRLFSIIFCVKNPCFLVVRKEFTLS